MVKSQGKVSEKSGNFEKDLDLQPWCKGKPTNLVDVC